MVDVAQVEPSAIEKATPESIERSGRIPRQHGHTGRPYIWLPDGSKRLYYSRPSGIGSELEDKENLMRWGERQVLEGVYRDDTILEYYADLRKRHGEDMSSRGFKTAAQKLSDEAKKVANATAKAELGTALHDATEAIDWGKDPGWIPPEFEELVYAYHAAMERAKREHGLKVIATELFMVNDEWRVAGTLDKLVLWEDKLVVADSKTSASLAYSKGKFCIQIGCYAGGMRYDPEAALDKIDKHGLGVGRSPYSLDQEVDRDTALIIHFASDGTKCDILEIPISHAQRGYETVQAVREWKNFWNRKDQRIEERPLISEDGAGQSWQYEQ